jgi:hypothetical protein
MSLKRSHTSGRSSFGGGPGDTGAKVDRQELFDELRRLAGTGEAFTPVDVALAIGAGEPQVSKALLGLAAEGYLEKVEVGKYKATPIGDLGQAEFLKAFARASKVDSTRQRDLSEIARLKQNNDTMRQRLLTAIAERDHYLAALKKHGIDPGPPPAPAPSPAPVAPGAPAGPLGAGASPGPEGLAASAPPPSEPAPGPGALAVPSPPSESPPSGPGDSGGHGGADGEAELSGSGPSVEPTQG